MHLSTLVKVALFATATAAFSPHHQVSFKNGIVSPQTLTAAGSSSYLQNQFSCKNSHRVHKLKQDDVEAKTSSLDALSSKESKALIDNGKADFIAPTIYAGFTAMLIYIIYQLRDAITFTTLGSKALALVTGALIWDNAIIAIGSIFFRDVETNPTKCEILRILSFPRFTLHAVGVSLQFIAVAEIGRSVGVDFLQNDVVQIGVGAAAVVVAILDRKKFVESPGTTLTTHEGSPWDALERDLVKFSHKEPEFACVIPVILLCLLMLTVGIVGKNIGVSPDLSNWLIFAAASGIVGDALPGSVVTFSGNLGEVGMQCGLLQAARIVYGGGV